MPTVKRCLALGLFLAAAFVSGEAAAQPAASQPAPGFVELNFPPNVKLRVVVEYLSKRLGINLLYDEQVDGKTLTIPSPTRVPADQLSRVDSTKFSACFLLPCRQRGMSPP